MQGLHSNLSIIWIANNVTFDIDTTVHMLQKFTIIVWNNLASEPETIIRRRDYILYGVIYTWDLFILMLKASIQIYALLCSTRATLQWIASINPYDPPILYYTLLTDRYARIWTWIPGFLGVDYSLAIGIQVLNLLSRLVGVFYIPLPNIA
uniref:Conserved hypothetical plastid protein n=1 Tax=Olisthodiscus luteus TaxID=83000 RepID=A0A7U0QGN0_OLILU|nr:conserved hypothetical plastid protein [Olisthodiscus luteus]QQW50558.1 conserved hypothetical plastid protein [Olisthodiscus luteus]